MPFCWYFIIVSPYANKSIMSGFPCFYWRVLINISNQWINKSWPSWIVQSRISAGSSELKTLEWDILNPNYLIWVSNGHTFGFLLKPFFLGYSREKSKTGFLKFRESLPFLNIILNDAHNFKFIGFINATLIGWILYFFQDTSTRLG